MDLELKGAFISSDSNNHEKRQRQSTKAVHTPSPCIKNIVTIPIPTSLDTLRDLYPNLAQHRIERLLEIIRQRERTLTPIPQSIEPLSRQSSLPPLVSRPDTPVPWVEEHVRTPTPRTPTPEPKPVKLPLTSFSYYRFVFGHKPFSTVEAPVSFYSERFGRWISLAKELPTPHHTPTETPLDKDFDGRLYFPLVHHKVYKALAEPRSLYEDAWEAFIGRESPRLKRKYSDLIDLTEDEELDPNDVSTSDINLWQEYQQWKLNTRQKRRRITKKYPPPFHTKT